MSGTASVEETLRNRHLRLINGLCLDMKTLNDRVGLPDPEKLQAFGDLADKINTSFQALKSLDPTHFGEKSGSFEFEPEKFSSILKKKPGTMECFGCGTTDTPEWRKGPIGPRTLCNACGLVYAKIVRRDKEEKNKPEDDAKQEQKMVKVMAEVIAISNMKQKKGRLSHSDFIPVDPSKPEEKVIKKAKKAAQSLASSEQSAFLPYLSSAASASAASASYRYPGVRPSSPPPVFKISESHTGFSVDDHPPLPHSNAFLYSSELNTSGLVMNAKWIQQQHPPQFEGIDANASDDAAAADIKRTSLSFLLN